jgi:serine O-acetyltransferase
MRTLLNQDALRWAYLGQPMEERLLSGKEMQALLYRHLPLRAMAWFRLGTWFKQREIALLPGFTQRLIYRRFGLEIQVGAPIGGGLYVAHPIGTVIAPQRIGRNCSIIAAVTIGMRNEWAFPDIGDDVFIGAGARVLGGIRIGNGVQIGANAVVTHDLPDGATAVGIPAHVTRIHGKPVDPAQAGKPDVSLPV